MCDSNNEFIMADNTGSDIRFHEEIETGALSKIEQYHKLMHDNKQLIYELKIGIISIIGSIVIVASIIYIVLQLRRNSKQIYAFVKNRRTSEDKGRLIDNSESSENLLSSRTRITIGAKCEKEFYV